MFYGAQVEGTIRSADIPCIIGPLPSSSRREDLPDVLTEQDYNRYTHETKTKRRRWPYIVIAAVCVVGVFAAWQIIGVPRVSAVTPGPDAYTSKKQAPIVLHVNGLGSLQSLRVTVDGRDFTAATSRSGDQLSIDPGTLQDGPHAVTFTASSPNLLRRKVTESWHFTVDTSVPTLKLGGTVEQGHVNTSPATFSGTTEPMSSVVVQAGAIKASGTADATGHFAVSAALPDGPATLVISATDRAGNSVTRHLRAYVDANPPVLKVTQVGKRTHHSTMIIHVSAIDKTATPKVKAVLDGAQVKIKGLVSHGKFKTAKLAQGKHTLVVKTTDRGGNVVTDAQTFVVDSTEHFGSASIWPGAVGQDVKTLQTKLIAAGVYNGAKTGVYDHATEVAVGKLQGKFGQPADGKVGPMTLNALAGQIVVDISQLRLYLYRDGHLIKSYPVATGQPAYPTPTGSYYIVNMQKDPTWLPPNSDWAKNATPIPPGTENPLGTRWMGTSASGVGMHGVPPSEDGTIGTYASHGCIRMHNWDAVDLFSRVVVGMPVLIRP